MTGAEKYDVNAVAARKASVLLRKLRTELVDLAEDDQLGSAVARDLLEDWKLLRPAYLIHAALLLALKESLRSAGLDLEPAVACTDLRLHWLLDGDVSVRLLTGSPPYFLDAEEQDQGFKYDAYACLEPEHDGVYALQGVMLGQELAEVPNTGGLFCTSRLVEMAKATKALLKITAERKQGPAVVFASAEEASQTAAEAQRAIWQLEAHWKTIKALVLKARGEPALPAELRAALEQSPLLMRRFKREVAFSRWLSSVPYEVYESAIEDAEELRQRMREALGRPARPTKPSPLWEPLLRRGKLVVNYLKNPGQIIEFPRLALLPPPLPVPVPRRAIAGARGKAGVVPPQVPSAIEAEIELNQPIRAKLILKMWKEETEDSGFQVQPYILSIQCTDESVLDHLRVKAVDPRTGQAFSLMQGKTPESGFRAWLVGLGEIEVALALDGVLTHIHTFQVAEKDK